LVAVDAIGLEERSDALLEVRFGVSLARGEVPFDGRLSEASAGQ
jgi:hypothetical protein